MLPTYLGSFFHFLGFVMALYIRSDIVVGWPAGWLMGGSILFVLRCQP